MSSKKVATIGMMIALAFVLNYVETLIPINIGIPGVKLGISNIVVIFSLYTLGPATAFFIAIIRIVLCGLTFGSISSMIYSLAGGLLSYFIMFLLKKTDRFSIYGVSVAGGISHNFGQIIMAIIILQTKLLIYYYPVLLLSGSIAGVLIGMISALLVKRLKSVYITE